MSNSFVHNAIINGDQIDGVVEILKSHGITGGRLGVLLEVLPSEWMHRLLKAMPDLKLVDVSQQIFEIRAKKSAEEIEAQRVCGKIADAAMRHFVRQPAGRKENE